jgi:hypothetical protein
MPIYDFGADFSVKQQSINSSASLDIPHGLPSTPGLKQLSHVEGGRTNIQGDGDVPTYPYHLEEFLQPGFRSLDDSMKQYWSGIRVPTKDSYRFMRVKIAGGDKSVLIWSDDLVEGRVRLPVAAISREGHEFNSEKFSPPYHAMTARYLSSRGDQVAKVYRPTPWLVDYNLTIWAERKRDVEYIIYQVLTRFNPLAEFRMFDGKIEGNVQLRYGGSTDASDKEAGFDTYAKVRYEVTVVAEAWLPLPEKIVKTVLGRVVTFQENVGEILLASKAQATGAVGGNLWYEPIVNPEEAEELIQ